MRRGAFRWLTTDVAFAGSIPGELRPLHGPAAVPALCRGGRAPGAGASSPQRILETAAGTGVVTAALHRALPDAEIVATDLNQAMLDVAAAARSVRTRSTFQQADAHRLPFEDDSFDLVVCQFGVMFFPDKVAGNAEARRVLRDGGRYLLVIWDRDRRNLARKVVGDAVADAVPATIRRCS